MKKIIMSASIAAAMVIPAAHAGVTIYGKMHASIDYTDVALGYGVSYYVDIDGARFDDDNFFDPLGDEQMWGVNSRASRIGFKGTEDLGNGLSLVWKAETGYDIADGGAWGGARNAYIGLAGDWGTFLYGIHDTPYKMSTGRLDPFADTAADFNAPTDFGMFTTNLFSFQDVRAENAIAYVSPNMNGLTFAAAIVPGEGAASYSAFVPSAFPGDDSDCKIDHDFCFDIDEDIHDGLADAYSVAAMYENNGLYLSAAYESLPAHSISWGFDGFPFSLPTGQQDKYRLGAGYTMNNLTINGVYENRTSDFGSMSIFEYDQKLEADSDIWQVSAVYTFGNSALKLAYGQGDMSLAKSESNPGETYSAYGYTGVLYDADKLERYGEQEVISVGLEHNFSKRTKVYALYTMQEADLGIKGSAQGADDDAGPFDVGGDAHLTAENDTFSMGMIHSF
ncbi:hypothetical protein BOV90_05935 [Solemya velum gill symbiont]|uniref:Porin domain-containing protein n=1 Tax=Solemya velum gill symbiont TaxID=2340 RepID=A0A1T2DQQ7_SOVGS|nr:porin [Solemya velum gill symbiont]OOY33969.1 hypothetical protein BOV88_12345 [Solemya velum gill symbiont]OOY36623.1 hypothetical protein BOV89_11480 [Solemya velum gill symbiont]OOY40070.1 hypothetical protein BOV90_05935 [Solemya velum gill symbiont]OOY44639.1 hypothetical protein BOV92_08190 [Solemya velum gill symbiont]OOY46046.1 hypothetical protein BOV93_11345 [Solemya velum gill symbiont]